MKQAYICHGLRTPIGRYGGSMSTVRPDDMLAQVIAAVMAATPNIAPEKMVWTL